MLPPVRHWPSYAIRGLALVILALIGAAGCSHPPLLVAPHRYVRLDALLPLNPSWAQIQSLDRELARLKNAPAQAGIFTYEPHAALPVFVPHASPPAYLAAERTQKIEEDARRYRASMQQSIDLANRAAMNLESRREQRRVESAVAARLAQAAETQRSENDLGSFAILQRLRSLTFRDLVVQSRVQDLAQAHSTGTRALREAQAEHAAIVDEIARLKLANKELRSQDVTKEIAHDREAFYREEKARSAERLAKRQFDLNSEKELQLKMAAGEPRDTGIPPRATPDLPPPDPRATPLPLPTEPAASVAPARSQLQPALDRQSVLWAAQRASLVSEIRADTWKAVQQVAHRRGWKLAPAPVPGALDGTDEAADDLRAQWRIGKGP